MGEQTANKLKSEIQDLKHRYTQETQSLTDQLRQLEISLTEASAKESATREHLQSLQEDKQR